MKIRNIITSIFSIIFVSCENKIPGYYENGDKDIKSVRIDEVFKVSYYEMPIYSGCGYVWINENECKFIELIGKERNRKNTVLYFKGKQIGTDTIKLIECPPKNTNDKNIKSDIEIIVNVK